MRFRSLLAGLLLISVACLGQAAPPLSSSQITFPVFTTLVQPSGAVVLVGNPGPQTYFYWLVANYPLGPLAPVLVGSLSNAPSVLSSANYNQIVPTYPTGVTSLDLLRTTSNIPPTGACACAVSTTVTSGNINDQSNSLSAYTVQAQVNVNAYAATLSNEVVSANTVHLLYRQNGSLIADLAIGGSGGSGNVVGPGSSTVGHIALFNNGTGTLLQDAGFGFPLPNAHLQNSAITVTAGTALNGGGLVSLGGATTLNVNNPAAIGITGNAATATAAQAAGTLCSSGQASQGVDVHWNAAGCFTPVGSGTVNTPGAANELAIYNSVTNAVFGSPNVNFAPGSPGTLNVNGNVSATQFTGVGAWILATSLPSVAPTPSASGAAALAVNTDGNFYVSQGNNSSTTSGAFAELQTVAGNGMPHVNGPVYDGSAASPGMVGESQPIDIGPNSPIVGSDCFAKANTVIAAGANTGVGILDMRGWSSGCTAQHDLFDANGTLSTNKPVKILWPATTVAICQPMITPASHFVMEATYNTQSVGFSGTLIKAGTAADGCAGNFPNGGATMTWTHPHPPFPVAGGAASGAYVALIYDGAQANNAARQTLNWKQQSFASNWENGFTFDCNGLCDFTWYSASKEEHTIVDQTIVRNYLWAGLFADRLGNNAANATPGGNATQSGPGNLKWIGIQGPASSTIAAGVPFKQVFMGNNTLIDLEGGGCTALGDGQAAHAYTKVAIGGGLAAPVLTNPGSGCTSAPSCSVDAPGSNPTTAAKCTATESGGAVTGVTFSNTPAGYWVGSSLVTGPDIEAGWGVGPSGPNFNFDTVIGGTTQAKFDHGQCQGVVNGCLLIGQETSPNDGGLVEGPNVANETGAASAVEIDKGSDGNVVIHDACQQDPISATRNIIVDNVFGITITTGASGTAPFCVPMYTQGQAYAGTLNVAAGTETAPSIAGPGLGGGWFSATVPCFGPGVTNESTCFSGSGPRVGSGGSFEVSSGVAPTAGKAAGISWTGSAWSFDTATLANAAAGINASAISGTTIAGTTLTASTAEVAPINERSFTADSSASHPITAFAVVGNGANPLAVRNALTSSTTGVIGICVSGCNVTGPAIIAVGGQATATFDGATTSGDYVQISTSAAGEVHDAGATCPTSGQVLGVVMATIGSTGTATMNLQGTTCSASAGGSVTSVTFTGDGTVLSSTPSTAVTTTGTLTATLASPAGGTVLNNSTAAAGAWTATPTIVLGVSSAGGTPATGSVKLNNSANTGSATLQAGSSVNNAVVTIPPNAAALTLWVNAGTNSVSTVGSTLDLSTATGTAAFKIPQTTGMTASAAGAFTFDTTNKNYHGFVNGADSLFLNIAAAPTTNVIPKYVIASGNLLAGSSSITDNGTTVSTAEPIVVGTAAGSAGITDKSAGFLAAAMGAQTTATCTTITGMNWNIAASKNYVLECKIPVTLAATATLQFCLNGPGTATSYTLEDDGGLGAAGVWAQFNTFIQTAWQTKTGASSAVATDSIVHVWAGIQNGSTASGTQLALQTAANGTNAITVGANATCSLTQTN